ncbi:TNR16-like protein, partial [Mya arenaria]
VLSVMAGCLENEVEIQYNSSFTICCTTCQTGNGVDIDCTPEVDTECTACVSGLTYSDTITHDDKCKPCSTCGNHSLFVLHPCNATQNTICLCPDGYFYNSELDKCELCDLCPAGWGASRKCNTNQNTICSPCEGNKTFSNKLDYYSQCDKCAECSSSEVMLQECMATEDTICFSVNAGRPRTDVTKRNYTTPAVDVNNEDDGSDIFPVYCAALVLVIVGLVGYVIYKKYQRMRSKRRQKAPCSHEDVEYSKASGGDSGVFVDNDSPKYYT